MVDNKFKLGDIVWKLNIDINNPSEAKLIKCKVKDYPIRGYVELEIMEGDKWVDYYEGGITTFLSSLVFKTKKECKTAMLQYWDRTEMYDKEIEKINKKIASLEDDLITILMEDISHKHIIGLIKKL